jgi:hypothetical protein
MNKKRLIITALILIFSFTLISAGLAKKKKGPTKIDPGTVKGEIDRIDPDYHKFGAQGWIIVTWDVEDPKDIDRRLLVVGGGSKEGDGIDCPITRDGQSLTFQDLKVGHKVEADFTMGYDALHCTAVRVLKDASCPAGTEPPASKE